MQIPAMEAVECAILHDHFEPIKGEAIYEIIQQAARLVYGVTEVDLMPMTTEKDIYVMAGGNRFLVSQNPEPLGQEGFQTALSTPYTSMAFPDARKAVETHRANTYVTIGKGAMNGSPELSKIIQDIGVDVNFVQSFQTKDEAELAMLACAMISKFIVQHHAACAMHWCASDNLVPQKFFEGATENMDFTMLGIRPYMTSSTGQMGEGHPIGMVANGSQWLLGKMVTFEEARVPINWMMQTLFGFIEVCKTRGSLIPNNESFSVEGEDWVVGVYHEKIEGFSQWEQCRLVVVHAPQFGIYGDTTARHDHHYENADDLRARAEAEVHEKQAANDVPITQENTFDTREAYQTDNPTVQSNWRPPETANTRQNNTSVAELRALAKRGQEEAAKADERAAGSSGGWLKNTLGRFKKK